MPAASTSQDPPPRLLTIPLQDFLNRSPKATLIIDSKLCDAYSLADETKRPMILKDLILQENETCKSDQQKAKITALLNDAESIEKGRSNIQSADGTLWMNLCFDDWRLLSVVPAKEDVNEESASTDVATERRAKEENALLERRHDGGAETLGEKGAEGGREVWSIASPEAPGIYPHETPTAYGAH